MSKQLQVSRRSGDRHSVLAEFPDMMLTTAEPAECKQAWKDLVGAKLKSRQLERARIVTSGPMTAASMAFDISRTKLIKSARQHNWKFVGITSPRPKAGKTTFAINLAFSLARQPGCRTALVDLDLRQPRIGQTLGLPDMAPTGSWLANEASVGDSFVRCDENLAVAAGRAGSDYPAAILQAPASKTALRHLQHELSPTIVLFDLPSMLGSDEVLCALPHLDAVILVAGAESSTLAEVDACEHELAEQTNVAGVILNKCRFAAEKYQF